MLLVQTFLISLMLYEIIGHTHKKEHVFHSHTKKVARELSVRRGDKRTIDHEKCKGSGQSCGVPKDKQETLTNRERAKNVGLCGNTIVKKGCYDDAGKQLSGKMLIDDEDQVHRTVNYSNNMHDLLCRCSKAALKNGYTLFGITDHGHCWGFNGTESSLPSIKESSSCVNASIMKPFCKESDKICAGAIRFMDVSSFIYLALVRNFQNGKDKFGESYRGTTFDVPYDFNSIMHYTLSSQYDLFTIDHSKPEIEVKERWRNICAKSKYGCIFGQKRGLSRADTFQVNQLFKCKIKPKTGWKCPIYTKITDFKMKYFQEFRKDLCLRLKLKQ